MWTATMAPDVVTMQKFIAPVYKYANETGSRVPISDWHETPDAKQVGFQARSVVGGVFYADVEKGADEIKNFLCYPNLRKGSWRLVQFSGTFFCLYRHLLVIVRTMYR